MKDRYLRQINIFYQQIRNTFAGLKLEEMLWQLAKGQVTLSATPDVLMSLLLLA